MGVLHKKSENTPSQRLLDNGLRDAVLEFCWHMPCFPLSCLSGSCRVYYPLPSSCCTNYSDTSDGVTRHLPMTPVVRPLCSCCVQEQLKPLGRSVARMYHSSVDYLAEEFTLAQVLLLGFRFIAQWSKIHLFLWCLGWTSVIFQTSIKIQPMPFFSRKPPFCSVIGTMMSDWSI